MLSEPLSPEKEQAAREILETAENSRLASMNQYELDKLPPFMRAAPIAVAADGIEETD